MGDQGNSLPSVAGSPRPPHPLQPLNHSHTSESRHFYRSLIASRTVADTEEKRIGGGLAFAGIAIGFVGLVALGAWVGTPFAGPLPGAVIWGAMLGASVLVAFGLLRVFTE